MKSTQNHETDYLIPDILVRGVVLRGIEEVIADLRSIQKTSPSTEPDFAARSALLHYLDWESQHLKGRYPAEQADSGQYLIQHLRQRAHDQGDDTLRDVYDHWLTDHKLPYFKALDVWRYPNDPAHLQILTGHTGLINAVALSANGSRVLSGANDRTARVWDAITGVELCRFEGHGASVTSVALSADGTRALTGALNQTARLWDTTTGAELRRFDGPSQAKQQHLYPAIVALSADGTRAVIRLAYQPVRLWDTSTGTELRTFDTPSQGSAVVTISADGNRVLAGFGDGNAQVWDANTGAILCEVASGSGPFRSVALSADGRRAVSTASYAMAENGSRAWTWHTTTGEALSDLTGHASEPAAMTLSADGSVVFGESWNEHTKLRLRDASTGLDLREFESQRSNCVALSANGRLAVSGGWNGKLWLWDLLVEGEPEDRVRDICPIHDVALSADGRLAMTVSTDKTTRLWDTSTGTELRRFEDLGKAVLGRSQTYHSAFWHVVLSADGRQAVSAGQGEDVALWDTSQQSVVRWLKGHRESVYGIALSVDGTRVLSGSSDNTARFWDTSTGLELCRFNSPIGALTAVALTADNRHALSASTDARIYLWDTSTGDELRCFEGHADKVWSIALSADGRRLLSGSSDKTLRLWDTSSGDELRRFVGHTDAVNCVALSGDSKRALSVSSDRTIRLWDTQTGQVIALLYLETIPSSVAFAAAQPTLIAVGDSRGLRMLHIMAPKASVKD